MWCHFSKEYTKEHKRFQPSFGEVKEAGKFIKFFFPSLVNENFIDFSFYFLTAKNPFFLLFSLFAMFCWFVLVRVLCWDPFCKLTCSLTRQHTHTNWHIRPSRSTKNKAYRDIRQRTTQELLYYKLKHSYTEKQKSVQCMEKE